MIINPLPPTEELLREVDVLVKKIGPVKTIVLPTASGLEHKIALPALARAFPDSKIGFAQGNGVSHFSCLLIGWEFPLKEQIFYWLMDSLIVIVVTGFRWDQLILV